MFHSVQQLRPIGLARMLLVDVHSVVHTLSALRVVPIFPRYQQLLSSSHDAAAQAMHLVERCTNVSARKLWGVPSHAFRSAFVRNSNGRAPRPGRSVWMVEETLCFSWNLSFVRTYPVGLERLSVLPHVGARISIA